MGFHDHVRDRYSISGTAWHLRQTLQSQGNIFQFKILRMVVGESLRERVFTETNVNSFYGCVLSYLCRNRGWS